MEQPSYYAILPANVRYDKALKPMEKILFAEITALSNKDGFCSASNKYFSELYEVDESTVSRWISRLASFGYATITLVRDERKAIIGRHIFVTPIDKKVNRVLTKKSIPYPQKSQYPIDKKVIVNNTSINTTSINTSTTTAEKDFFDLKDPDINIADPDAGVKAAQKMAAYFKADGADQWRMMNGPEDEKAIDAICWDWANSERNISLVPFWRRHVGKLANWITSYKNRQHDNNTSTQRNGRVQQRPTDALTLSFDEFQQRFGSLSPSGKPKG